MPKYTNDSLIKYLAKADSRSKWYFIPYIIAIIIVLIAFFYFNVYVSIGIGIILFFIAKTLSTGLRHPTFFVPAKFDTRIGILVFMGYSNLVGKKDFLEGIGKLVWRFARTIVIENVDNALGYHISKDEYGVIIMSNDEYFYKDFIDTANQVKSIILFLDDYKESLEILKLIKENKLHAKTIVVMEPDNERGWKALREKALKEKINLPYFNPEGMLYLPKNDFSIFKSFISEYGIIELKHISKIIQTNYSEENHHIKDCFPKNNYIEKYYFSLSFQQDFPETIKTYEDYAQSLTYRDTSLFNHYLEERIYSIFEDINNMKPLDKLIETFSNEEFKLFIEVLKEIDLRKKYKIEVLKVLKERVIFQNKSNLLKYLEN